MKPVAFHRTGRHAKGFCGFRLAVAGEEPAFDDLQPPRVLSFETSQQVVELEKLRGLRLHGHLAIAERHDPAAAPFPGPPLSRMIDDDLAHCPGGNRKEVIAVLPLHLRLIDQPQVHLVHDRAGVEREAGPPGSELPSCNPPELGVDEAHQAVERTGLTVTVGDENGRDRLGCGHDAALMPQCRGHTAAKGILRPAYYAEYSPGLRDRYSIGVRSCISTFPCCPRC
jgi:hypothetical protein